MTDSIKNIDQSISNMSETCRIIYFKSENRDIIRTAIDQSSALWERLERLSGKQLPHSGSLFAHLEAGRKCVDISSMFQYGNNSGSLVLKAQEDNQKPNSPLILYASDFQVYDKAAAGFMFKAFLNSKALRHTLLLVSSSVLNIPDGFSNAVELVQDPYISKQDISEKLADAVHAEEAKRGRKFFSDQELDAFAQDFVGLSELQVDTVLMRLNGYLCTSLRDGIHRNRISDEKKKEIEKDPTVNFRDVPEEETVCGLENYSKWLEERREDFHNPIAAAAQGTPAPKGVLLCGVPGTGKSAAARETARILGVPLIQFDISRIQSEKLGKSEEKLRGYLERVSAFGDCVMLMDEIEKVFSVTEHTHEVKRAMLSLLLDWMQTRKANVFTFITANDISSLPPELLRDGRLSGRFFAFMPSRDDLCDILGLKLMKIRNLFNAGFQKLLSELDRERKWRSLPEQERKKTPRPQIENPFAEMFSDLAGEAKKSDRLLFMTGANIEVLVELANREMRKQVREKKAAAPYGVTEYIAALRKCALSPSFVPQGQSNMDDIVAMWFEANRRQYQDVSANSVLPFNRFSDGHFKALEPVSNPYDEYLREVLRARIEEQVREQAERKSYLRRVGSVKK